MVEDLKDLLVEIGKSNELTLFFKNLWKEGSIQAKLFFLHREQLLPFEDKFILPYLFWSNVREEKEKSILDITTELEEIKRQQAWNKLGFDKLLNGFKDIIAYWAIKVIRENESIKRLVLDKTFPFGKMKEILGDYTKINFDVLKEEEIEKIPELEYIMKTSSMRFIKTFDPLKFIEALSSTSGIASTLPVMGIPQLYEILETSDIGFDEYTEIINELYVLKLVSNSQTLFWCEQCRDTPQIFVTTSRIDPNHLDMECLKCKKQMSVSSMYNIDLLLRESILFKDGMLAVALGWLFDQKKIKWDFSVHNKYENDFICETKNGKILFECKMHLIPRDERSFEGQLKQDLNLLITHVQTLSKEGTHLNKAYLVYNYGLEDYSEETKKILNLPKLRRGITKHKIEIIGFPEVTSVLEKESIGK
jgi:hypothetical protein